MLVDANAYVGHWPFKKLKYNTCETLLGRMNQFGTDVSVVSNLDGIFYKNTQPANQDLYAEIKSKSNFKDRFVPFAVINPIYGGWKNDLEESVTKLGMKGIRLYPLYHGYDITHPACIELVKRARDRGLPVAFSLRMVDSRPSSWLDIEQEWRLKDIVPLVRQVPDAKYLILNLANSLQLTDEEMALIKSPNILFDTSGRIITSMKEQLKIFGPDKFAFGTHSPVLDYLTGLLRIESLRPAEADEQTKNKLRSGNIRRIISL